jgi:uridine phosphorylase/uncharacterized protein (DUF952 family)
MPLLFHITDWPYAGQQALNPASLQSEGFVHLSSASQLLGTAERWYGQQEQVGVLVLDAEALGSGLVWEDLYHHGQEFPHLYHAIPEAALLAVARLSRDSQGRYRWPESLGAAISPLLEAPDSGEALIEPARRFPSPSLPELAVLHFFPAVMADLVASPGVEVRTGLGSAIGPDPIVVLERQGQRLAVCVPGVGGPLAAVAVEELHALGCRRFVACGGAGSLQPGQDMGALVLVEGALRDEGLSHHYLAADQKVMTDPGALRVAACCLQGGKVSFRPGLTWTTDALYRETPARLARRRSQGCLTVEMECAAMLAVASYRGVPLVPLLYCGDDLSGQEWDFRDWTAAQNVQQRLLWLSIQIALDLGRADL